MTTTKRKKKAYPAWLELTNGGVRCLRCGRTERTPVPMPVAAYGAWTDYVAALHAECKDVGRVDTPPLSVDEWAAGHDTGTSSMSIYRHMRGLPPDPLRGVTHPYDPSDFGRCYRLLKLAPEWRARLREMAQHSAEWAALAPAWGHLTELWDEERPSGSCPKLYAEMQRLLDGARASRRAS